MSDGDGCAIGGPHRPRRPQSRGFVALGTGECRGGGLSKDAPVGPGEPAELRLLVTVVAPTPDGEREGWARLGGEGLARAYTDSEPDCGPEDVTQLHQEIPGFDEPILADAADYETSGLKEPSLIRLGFLAVLPEGRET